LSDEVNHSRHLYYAALENSENQFNDITYFIKYYIDTMLIQLERAKELFGAKATNQLSVRQKAVIDLLKKDYSKTITRKKYSAIYKVSVEIATRELEELYERKTIFKRKHGNCYEYGYGRYFEAM
jgi:Fic family protein